MFISRHRLNAHIVSLLALFAAACGEEPPPFVDAPVTELHLTVQVQDHPLLDAVVMSDTCASWDGLSCDEVADEDSDIHVKVQEGDCVKNKDGRPIRAQAMNVDGQSWGTIVLYAGCMVDDNHYAPGDEINVNSIPALQRSVLHELTHLLGVERHVARQCAEPDKYARLYGDAQGPICGNAIMNPTNSGAQELTDMDRRAFAVRSPWGLWPKTADEPELIWMEPGQQTAAVDPSLLGLQATGGFVHVLCDETN